MRRWGLLMIIICSIWGSTAAQMDQIWRYYYPEFTNSSESNLYFRLENNNFLKNNEYFSDYSQGYTLLGYSVQPSFMYYAGSRLRIKAGVHILQFTGMNEFTEVLPTFSIHTKLAKNLDLIMGGLKGDVHHRLIEPIFNPENQYTRPIENGFQFIYKNDKLWFDGWVDWEQFIFLGDEKPEKFTAGISTEYQILNSTSGWNINIPAQFIATHLGGQISTYKEAMQSLANMATGVSFRKTLGTGFIQHFAASSYLAWYQDLTEKSGLPFSNGHAVYPVGEVGYKYGALMFGYWYANDFVAPKGSSIFHSVSDYNNDIYQQERHLLTAKLSFSRTFLKQIKFSAMVETYFDIPASHLEYAYGLNLLFTPNFFLKKVVFD